MPADAPTLLAVAFDLDGLMFDTEALFVRVATEMLAERGKAFTPEIMAAMIGRQWPVAGKAFREMAGLSESLDALREESRRRFRALMDTAVHPTPGLFALLAHLGRDGWPLAVCTSSRREYAERLLAHHGLRGYFAFLLTAEDVTHGKPDPEIYRTAAARFGISPGALLVLEDSPAGVAAATAAGAFAVGIPHEHSPAAGLAAARLVVDRLDDPRLLALVDRPPPSVPDAGPEPEPEPESAGAPLDSLAYTLARYADAPRRLRCDAGDPDALAAWQEAARAKLRELLGPMPADRVPPDATPGAARRRPGYTRRSITFRTREHLAACGYLLVPDGLTAPAPAVLCLPGHGRGADDIVGIDEDGRDRDAPDGYQRDFAVQCARRGYVALALEPLGFGRRRDPAARAAGPQASSCAPAAGAALLLGETMVGWRVWDTLRGLDVLAARPEVDPDRLALMGISGGGTVALYAAALDARVKATVLSCSFGTFRDSIYSISHCIDNYVPGVLNWFEMADLAAMVAPRALVVEAGESDPIFPLAGVEAALRDAARAYAAAGAPDRLAHAVSPAGHQFDGTAAFEALGRRL
jgi:HAD superfamily hydrolase (TIGR01509 family)